MTQALHHIEEATRPADELAHVLRDYMDVTDRLARTHETLQHEIERLRFELESKDRELERRRRLAALGELAAGVAHEVRNPLGAIRLYSGLLKSACGGAASAIELIEKIEAGIDAINRVVEDTLALTPRSHRLSPEAVSHVLARAAEACKAALDVAVVEIVVEDLCPQQRVNVDGDGLHRSLVNLITNAAEASPVGAVVHLCARERGDGVAIHVRDDGPGLPDELLDRIFDPFVTTKEKGTGLGLTIAHRLIEAHGGTLSARNRLGGGAEFEVWLPHAASFERKTG